MGETVAGLVGGQPQYIRASRSCPACRRTRRSCSSRWSHDIRAARPDLPAGGRRHLGRGGACRSQQGQGSCSTGSALPADDWFVTRGNHDRAHAAPSTPRAGRPVAGQRLLPRRVLPGRPTRPTSPRDLSGLRVIGLDTYDKPGNGGDAGGMSAEQMAWFQTSWQETDQPTLVFGHHPLIVAGLRLPASAPARARRRPRRPPSSADYAKTPGRVPAPCRPHAPQPAHGRSAAPDVVQQEVAAVKEYPGGFSMLRLHTRRLRPELLQVHAATWRARGASAAAWRSPATGRSSPSAHVADRNTVVARDLSGLHKPQSADSQSATSPPGAGSRSPAPVPCALRLRCWRARKPPACPVLGTPGICAGLLTEIPGLADAHPCER